MLVWIIRPDLLERAADLFFCLFLSEDGDTFTVEGVKPQNRSVNLQELTFYFGNVERPDSLAVVRRLRPRRVEKPTT